MNHVGTVAEPALSEAEAAVQSAQRAQRHPVGVTVAVRVKVSTT
jgi:hypothetical protein